MKKKNLIILLIFPFLISIFCTTAINTTYNVIDVDISHIEWKYNDNEPFKISDELYLLKASGVNQRNYEVADKDDLVWTVKNADASDEPYAEIVKDGDNYYLRTLKQGSVTITCSNQKGNVARSMTGIIYERAALLLYPTVPSAQISIDETLYYGQYDHYNGNTAYIDMTLTAVPSGITSSLDAKWSDNIEYDQKTGKIKIISEGDAYLTVYDKSGDALPASFKFTVVKDGVNVYSYDDLINCTNKSDNGEIVVLRKNFESLENAYMLNSEGKPIISAGAPVLKEKNTECFGNYDYRSGKFSFGDEIYKFKTTYNTSYISQWNKFAAENKQYSEASDTVRVGLHVKKDFYGNGYTINLHNLTYPYSYVLSVGQNGKNVRIPQLTADNLFRGPLSLYALGDPNNMPLVGLYGQDNIGMYVEGDGITVNDVNLRNCDFGERMANLDTVGTVMEIYGDNVTVKNSRISNGKNVVRSFSSQNLTIQNCLISNARNFLFLTGANEYVPVDLSLTKTFSGIDSEKIQAKISEFISKGGEGDEMLNAFLISYFDDAKDRENVRKFIRSVQDALNQTNGNLAYKGSTTIDDTYFYRSGIASICMEAQFNSTFLQTATPSVIVNDIFPMISTEDKNLIPMVPQNISGVSYPVSVNLTGKTEFYDYKSPDDVDMSSLIEENITEIANSIGLYEGTISIDMIFPLRTILMQKANAGKNTHYDSKSNKTYVNIPIAYYGGGLNLSTVNIETDSRESVSGGVEIDLLDTYLNLKGPEQAETLFERMKGLMLKTVPVVMGFEPFEFNFVRNGYLFGETPKISDLIENAKGE
jgi:hypothetical protein